MSSGLQDAAITSFLQFIEEKGVKAYNSLSGLGCRSERVSRCLRQEMNLLYRKTKAEWRHREEEPKKGFCKDGGLTRVRDLASLRKHFRAGFMTMPASQEHGQLPCAGGMATRSLSLHSVGSVDSGEHRCTRKAPDRPPRQPSTKPGLLPAGRNSAGGEGDGQKGERSRHAGTRAGRGELVHSPVTLSWGQTWDAVTPSHDIPSGVRHSLCYTCPGDRHGALLHRPVTPSWGQTGIITMSCYTLLGSDTSAVTPSHYAHLGSDPGCCHPLSGPSPERERLQPLFEYPKGLLLKFWLHVNLHATDLQLPGDCGVGGSLGASPSWFIPGWPPMGPGSGQSRVWARADRLPLSWGYVRVRLSLEKGHMVSVGLSSEWNNGGSFPFVLTVDGGHDGRRACNHFVEPLGSVCLRRVDLPVAAHFNSPSYSLPDMSAHGLMRCQTEAACKLEEQRLILHPGALQPDGINHGTYRYTNQAALPPFKMYRGLLGVIAQQGLTIGGPISRSESPTPTVSPLSSPATQRPGAKGSDGGHRGFPLPRGSCSFDEPVQAAGYRAQGCPLSDLRRPLEGEGEEDNDDEPVYIEMVGDVSREQPATAGDEEVGHTEAIYEEMKYPLQEEGWRTAKLGMIPEPSPRLPSEQGLGLTRIPRPPPSKGRPHDIPPPFPNLLLHRPPLLAFPQGCCRKVHRTPPQAEPPLQGSRPLKEDRPAQGALLPSGRARSHSTPLPPQASGQQRQEKEVPNSQALTCAPSKGLGPQGLGQQGLGPQGLGPASTEGDKLDSFTIACSSITAAGDQKPCADKDLSNLQGLFGRASGSSRPLPNLYKVPVAHALLEPAAMWPCFPATCKRPPAYDSLRAKACPAALHSAVKTPVPERSSLCCTRLPAGTDSQLLAGCEEEGAASAGRIWQRRLSNGKKAKESEGAPRAQVGVEEPLAKEETLALLVKSQGLEVSAVKGPTRAGGHPPCPLVCQWSADSALSQRLGRSVSTTGVQHSLPHLQRQCSQSRDSPTQGFQQQQALREKDGKLLEVIERKRCLCKEIKARRGPDRSLCKRDSMPILPSWRKGVDSRKTATPPCQRQHTVLWDTAI
ncbi:neuronal tyrosine-phosphorylated phosphoinositide-3-kinase adapter 1-like [Narcine bancroftii]|uniref:neuronal tyrosine-phosphorylated phosphoinositide-3-kinase adapter 1-like n=1 Tax=Narcine bancroftii TaxID=1343680 RepID=UPI003831894E